MATTRPAPARAKAEAAAAPVLKVTQYDQVSSFLVAAVLALSAIVFLLVVAYISSRPPKIERSVPLELEESPGGSPDGVAGESLQIDSPEPENVEATVAESLQDAVQTTEVIQDVVSMADTAAGQARTQSQFLPVLEQTGKAGSSTGTGKHRPLGFGTGRGGFPREQRWFVRFSERGTLEEYARQLDFFGIELGALVNGEKIVYLSDLASDRPKTHTANSGAEEKRLYMTWQGGERRQGDIMLFKKVGIDVGSGVIFHFYPAKTENELAQLERAYKGKKADQIRRTYFVVRTDSKGYKFEVTQQTLLQ